MNLNKHPFLDYGFRVIAIILLIFLSLEVDKFCFGIMNVSSTIAFGLGVALFCGSNLIFAYIVVDMIKSIINKIKK
jgi:hypothetical protein